MSRCGIIILAAGGSVRMGTAKQSLEFAGSTLLAHAVDTALDSKCRPVIVVLGSRADSLAKLVKAKPVEVVINPNWAAGMGTSIRCGITAIGKNPSDAVLIFLCDQPLVASKKLDEMLETHFAADKPITAAFYAKTFGTPVIFAASMFDELATLKDDQGGKVLIRRHEKNVQSFALPEAEVDVDTTQDFAVLLERLNIFANQSNERIAGDLTVRDNATPKKSRARRVLPK